MHNELHGFMEKHSPIVDLAAIPLFKSLTYCLKEENVIT